VDFLTVEERRIRLGAEHALKMLETREAARFWRAGWAEEKKK
jgi:hypothetical protein